MSAAPNISPLLSRLVPWYGAKGNRALRDRIIVELGESTGFLEAAAGSCAVSLAKPPSAMTLVNDLHGDLVNVARVMASERWADLADRCTRTLFSEELYLECRRRWSEASQRVVAPSVEAVQAEHVDAAWAYMVSQWQGINGVSGTGRGKSQMAKRYTVGGGHGGKRWQSVAESMPAWHSIMQGWTILQGDGIELTERLADDGQWSVYWDPPYFRKGDKYVHDFEPGPIGDDHPLLEVARKRSTECVERTRRFGHHGLLFDVLASKRATRIVVSYYDEPEIRELYADWTLIEMPITKAMVNQGRRDVGGKSTAPEILLINGPSYAGGSVFGGGA